jgi:hypothetical protein
MTTRTLFIALATVFNVVSSVDAGSTATTLSLLALIPTLPAVVLIPKNVAAMRLAATEKARPVVCRYPIAYVVSDGITTHTFLYHSGQKPAS